MKDFLKSLLIIMVPMLLGSMTVLCSDSGTAGRNIVVRFSDGKDIPVSVDKEWTASDAGDCFVSAAGIKLCSGIASSGGMSPCEWIQAAARFMDAPGDKEIQSTVAQISKEEIEGTSFSSGCRGRVISPKLNAVFYRIVFSSGGDNLYVLKTPPLVWGKDLDKQNISEFDSRIEKLISGMSRKTGEKQQEKQPQTAAKNAIEKMETAATATVPVPEIKVESKEEPAVEEIPAPQQETLVVEKVERQKEVIIVAKEEAVFQSAKEPVIEVKETPVSPQSFPGLDEEKKTEAPIASSRADMLIVADKLRLRGKNLEAAEKYEDLLATYPYDATIGLGDTALSQLKYDSAVSYYKKAVEINPDLPDAYNGLGSVELMNGNYSGAEEKFHIATEKKPGNAGTLANLGWLELRKSNYPEAEGYFKQTLALSPDLDSFAAAANGLTDIAFTSNKYDEAITWNNSLIEKFPEYPEAHANLVRLYLETGKADRGLKEATLLEGLLPGAPGVKILAARAYYEAGRYVDASDRICPMVESDIIVAPSESLITCAKALRKSGEKKRASGLMERAVNLSSATPEYFIILAEMLVEDGSSPDAKEILKEGSRRFPANEGIKKALGK